FILTRVSGICDAVGFVHASRAWRDDRLVVGELGVAGLCFGLGAVSYILFIRYLNRIGLTAPELQTLGWFAVTVVGVAVIQGSISEWSNIDRFVAAVATLSVGWLVVHDG